MIIDAVEFLRLPSRRNGLGEVLHAAFFWRL